MAKTIPKKAARGDGKKKASAGPYSRPVEAKISGPRSRFRHKVRSPVSILLTEKGHEKMQRELLRTSLSRSDFFETLLHAHGHDVKALQPGELAATGT
jgi:hypothetical protein